MSVFRLLLLLLQIGAETTGVFIFLHLLRHKLNGERTCANANAPSEVAAPGSRGEGKVKAAVFPNVSSSPRENRESNEL